MIQVEHLTITTLKGRQLLKDFSFVLNDGDKMALIGEEGDGKSTFLKILAGIDVSDYVTYSGTISCQGGRTGYLPQKIQQEWDRQTVLGYLVKQHPDDPLDPEIYADWAALNQALVAVNLDPAQFLTDRTIGTLSGGERVKAALARLLYQQPDNLLLDEPTNDLDLQTMIWLESFIQRTDLPMIFISHDETLLAHCSNAILHLEQLKKKQEPRMTVERVGYQEYQQRRGQWIEKNNQLAAKEKAQLDAKLERWRQLYQKVDYQQKTISRQDPHGAALLKKKMHAVKAAGRRLDQEKEQLTAKFEPEEAIDLFFPPIDMNPGKVILDLHLDQLTAGDKVLAGPIDLTVLGKDKLCIVGPNGSGKTTLIRLIWDRLKDRGDLKAGYMPQNYWEVMDYDLTPQEFLRLSRRKEDVQRVLTLLGSLKFTAEEMSHPIGGLSEGQKCKILLCGLVQQGCDVLVLDEPTRNLSPLSNPQIRRMLNDYGGCIIAVSHDRRFIAEVANRILDFSEFL
jgi:ATPase subunit of ABC transporter with duplicated ATPase domains